MAIKGSIEHRFTNGGNGQSEFFGMMYNFLNGMALSGSNGVTKIAFNKGLNGNVGMGLWDSAVPFTDNAFAVFRFGNAIIPFYIMIQVVWQGTNTFGAAPGNPGLIYGNSYPWDITNNATQGGGVGIQYAQRLDGGNPWAGTQNNDGNDTKGTPVWSPGGSVLAVWPRNNSVGGNYVTNKENCFAFLTGRNDSTSWFTSANPNTNNVGFKVHFIADENNFAVIVDSQADGTYGIHMFGHYTPKPGLAVQMPYFAFHAMNQTNDPILLRNQQYGATGLQEWDGGVVHPTASLGVKGAVFETVGLLFSSPFSPNKLVPPNTGRFDMAPIFIGMKDTAPNNGFLGVVDFTRYVYGIASQFTSGDKTLAAWGNTNQNSAKLVLPWDGKTAPGVGNSRAGIQFGY